MRPRRFGPRRLQGLEELLTGAGVRQAAGHAHHRQGVLKGKSSVSGDELLFEGWGLRGKATTSGAVLAPCSCARPSASAAMVGDLKSSTGEMPSSLPILTACT